MTQNMFNFKHVKPTSFSTPNLVRLDGFRTAATTSKGFIFKPVFTGTKAKGWKDIETVTGKKFGSYEQAVSYINGLGGGDKGKSAGGFLGNLFHDIVDLPVGLGIGLVKGNIAVGKDAWDAATGDFNFSNTHEIGGAIAKNYKDTYGPLAHGNFGEFWDNVYNNPLGPILDVASIFTLGAGAAVKGGSLLAKAGVATKTTSKLAALGKSEALLARAPATIRRGHFEEGDPIAQVHRMTSKNPVIRARQKVIYKVLTHEKLPKGAGIKLEERRYVSRLKKTQNRKMAGEMYRTPEGHDVPAIIEYDKAKHSGGLLHREPTPHEYAAVHILGNIGSHMTPKQAVDNAIRLAREEGHPPPVTELALWQHPKTLKLIDRALSDHRAGKDNDILKLHAAIDHYGQVDAAQKGLDINTIKARRWATPAHLSSNKGILGAVEHAVRQMNSSLDKETEAVAGLRRSVVSNVQTHLYARAYEAGMDMGTFLRTHEANGTLVQMWDSIYKPIDAAESLRTHRINDTAFIEPAVKPGELNPIYVPHKTGITTSGKSGAGRGTGDLSPQNNKVVLAALRMAIGEDMMGPENARTLRIIAARSAHDNMIKASVEVDGSDVSQMLSNGYLLVKQIEGGPDDYMTKTSRQQIEAAFDHADESTLMPTLRSFFTTKDKDSVFEKGAPARNGGKYLMIREPLANQLIQEYIAGGKFTKMFVETPLKLWKYVVLGLSPRNIVTNVVGNTIMAGLLSQNPVSAMRIIVHSALQTLTPKQIADKLAMKGALGVSDGFLMRVFPEHKQASFSHGELNLTGKAQHYAFAYRATHAQEISLREGFLMDLIRHDDTIRAVFKRNPTGAKGTQTRWEAAAESVFRRNTRLRDDMSDRVDDALGNYRDFSNAEIKLRRVMPFYSWYRHASRTTKALTARPTTLAGMAALGRVGQQENQQAFGNVPDFMKAFAPLGAGKDGHQAGINTSGLNPFHALAEMAQGGKALVGGDAAGSTAKLSGFMSPFLVSGIEQLTGKSLLTGAPSKAPYGGHGGFLGGLASRVVAGTPEMRLGAATLKSMDDGPSGLGLLTPTGQLKKPKEPTLSKDLKTNVLNFAGFPYKDVNVNAAQEWQKTLDQAKTYHLPKPRKKKPKTYTMQSFNFGVK